MNNAKARHASRRSLQLESLESRALLAGNVLVTVTNNTLKITGDAAANGVQISSRQTASGTELVVSGVTLGSAATKINGGTIPFSVSDQLQGIEVKLAGGGDFLLINNTTPATPPPPPVRLPGTVNIDLAEGFDRFTGRFINQDLVTVATGAGNDKIDIRGSSTSRLTILADPLHSDVNPVGGNDTVYLNNVISSVNLAINTYDGDDHVTITGKVTAKDVTVDTGEGNDIVDILGAPSMSMAKLTISTNQGNDTITVRNVTTSGTLSIQSDFSVFDGLDVVTLDRVHAASMFVVLGHGNDHLTVKSSNGDSASFDGGSETDQYTDGGGNAFGTFAKTNFES